MHDGGEGGSCGEAEVEKLRKGSMIVKRQGQAGDADGTGAHNKGYGQGTDHPVTRNSD